MKTSRISGNPRIKYHSEIGSKEDRIHTDEKVIALVDEGHLTQYKFNAVAMRKRKRRSLLICRLKTFQVLADCNLSILYFVVKALVDYKHIFYNYIYVQISSV